MCRSTSLDRRILPSECVRTDVRTCGVIKLAPFPTTVPTFKDQLLWCSIFLASTYNLPCDTSEVVRENSSRNILAIPLELRTYLRTFIAFYIPSFSVLRSSSQYLRCQKLHYSLIYYCSPRIFSTRPPSECERPTEPLSLTHIPEETSLGISATFK